MKRILLAFALLAGAAHAQVVLEVPAAACTPTAAAAASLPAGTYQCRAPLPASTAVVVPAPVTPPPVVTPPPTNVTPLPLIAAQARAEAPNDADGSSSSYTTKALSSTGVASPLSALYTISRGGTPRFGFAMVDGKPTVLHRVVKGDPLRNGGDRSELSYDGFNFANGEEVWFAAAYKFGADMATGSSTGGNSDRFSIQQTHQNATSPNPIGNPFGLVWIGGGAMEGLNWIVSYQGNDYPIYRTPVVVGQWVRIITRYRSGFNAAGDAPLLEAWVAIGSGDYTKLAVLPGASANQQFGDPLSKKDSKNDWPKIGIYKWSTGSWGSTSSRTMNSSGLYAGKGADLLEAAKASLAGY